MFRRIVNENKDDYFHAPKSEKPWIAERVVQIVRNLDPPGRFLSPVDGAFKNCRRKNIGILWRDVGGKKAKAKASQCLRERKQDGISPPPPKGESNLPSATNTASIQNDGNDAISNFPDDFDKNGNNKTYLRVATNVCTPSSYHPQFEQTSMNSYQHWGGNFLPGVPTEYPCRVSEEGEFSSELPTSYYHAVSPNNDDLPNYHHTISPNEKCREEIECDQKNNQSSWLGSFHSLQSHMIDSTMSCSSPIVPLDLEKQSRESHSVNYKKTIRFFARPSSPAMSELTEHSASGEGVCL